MSRLHILAVGTALTFACCDIGTASADIVYTGSIASQDATLYASPGLSVTIPDFNPLADSALANIVITVTTSSVADISVTNVSTTPYSFTNATAATTIALTGPQGYSSTLTTVSTLANGVAGGGTLVTGGQLSFTEPGVSNFPGIPGGATSTVSVDQADFANFEGTGSFALTFINLAGSATFGGTAVSAPSNTLYFGGGDDLALTVSVDFETVAEPTSVMLIATGLLGISLVQNRRRPRSR